MKKLLGLIILATLIVACGLACGGSSTGPEPVTTEQQVKFGFVMTKDEWYKCSIAVQGNPNRTIVLYIGGQQVGSLTCSSPVATQNFSTLVTPGTYTWKAEGRNSKNRLLNWFGTRAANYPFGTTIFLVCD